MQDKFDEVLKCLEKATDILQEIAQEKGKSMVIHQASVHLFESSAWLQLAQEQCNGN